jgi:hypothetical protein
MFSNPSGSPYMYLMTITSPLHPVLVQPTADITVNFRLLPGATVEGEGPLSVMQYLRDALGPE